MGGLPEVATQPDVAARAVTVQAGGFADDGQLGRQPGAGERVSRPAHALVHQRRQDNLGVGRTRPRRATVASAENMAAMLPLVSQEPRPCNRPLRDGPQLGGRGAHGVHVRRQHAAQPFPGRFEAQEQIRAARKDRLWLRSRPHRRAWVERKPPPAPPRPGCIRRQGVRAGQRNQFAEQSNRFHEASAHRAP
jgi:hypothetical protein